MTIPEANLTLALITWALVVAISYSHAREFGAFKGIVWLLGGTVLATTTLLVVTAAGQVFHELDRNMLGVVAGFLRGVALVLVVSYSYYWFGRRHKA